MPYFLFPNTKSAKQADLAALKIADDIAEDDPRWEWSFKSLIPTDTEETSALNPEVTVGEILATGQHYERINKLLSAPPFRSLISLSDWGFTIVLNITLLIHMAYMFFLSLQSWKLFTVCGDDQLATNTTIISFHDLAASYNSVNFTGGVDKDQIDILTETTVTLLIIVAPILLPGFYFLYLLFWIVFMVYALFQYHVLQTISRKRSTKFRVGDIEHLFGVLIIKLCGLVYSGAFLSWYIIGALYNDDSYCKLDYYVHLLSVALLFGWIYTLDFTRGIKNLHHIVIMMRHILYKDMIRFLFIYVIILLAFSQGYMALEYRALDQSIGNTTFMVFNWMLGTAEVEYNYEHGMFGRVLYAAFIITSTIVLLNLLVAMMADSYALVRDSSEGLWKMSALQIRLEYQRLMMRFFGPPQVLKFDYHARKCLCKNTCKNPGKKHGHKVVWLLRTRVKHEEDASPIILNFLHEK